MKLSMAARGFGLWLALWASGATMAQDQAPAQVSGNVGILWQSYAEDSLIGAVVPPSKTGYNAFANVLYNQGDFSAGLRYESYLNSVLGFPGRFDGSGVGYRFARYADRDRGIDVTVGNFYDQFGKPGLKPRAYEERNLGIDNALDGFRLGHLKDGLRPGPSTASKCFDFRDGLINGPGVVRAVDAEADLNTLVAAWADKTTKVTLGASFVRRSSQERRSMWTACSRDAPKHQSGHRVNAVRKGWIASAEYAGKINDPSADNGYTYRNGEALLATLGYSKKAFRGRCSPPKWWTT